VSAVAWFLRSISDRDTHRGIYSSATRSVHAVCGIEFQPLKRATGAPIAFTPSPPDRDQVCQQCSGWFYASEPPKADHSPPAVSAQAHSLGLPDTLDQVRELFFWL